jgi:hypothetical protein
MSEQKSKRELKIHVRFEASRLADECLANAYEQVVPLVRRTTAASGETAYELPEPKERKTGGMHG